MTIRAGWAPDWPLAVFVEILFRDVFVLPHHDHDLAVILRRVESRRRLLRLLVEIALLIRVLAWQGKNRQLPAPGLCRRRRCCANGQSLCSQFS
jgi:hypothetical protein